MMRASAAAFALLLAACEPAGAPPSAPAAPPGPPVVAVVAVVARPLAKTLRLSGELLANRDVALHARVPGFVDSVAVDRGSPVKQGQPLLRLVAPELTAAAAEAAARLASSEATLKRLQGASAVPGAVAANDLEIAAKVVEAERARARICQDHLAYLVLAAPFDGLITERNVHEGSLVGPSAAAPLLRLQELSRLRLVLPLPEIAAGAVEPGAVLTFSAPAHPGVAFQGTLARISRTLDVKTRTMPVELDVDNADGRLAPGMVPEVSWPMKRAAATLFVPPTSIVTTTERIFVVRVKEGVAEWIDVRPGVSTGALVEVFGPLKEGDTVALRGSDEIRPGKVTVKESR